MRLLLIASLTVSTLAVPWTASAAPGPWLEAEDGTLSGTVVESTVEGFSGAGYVAGFDEAADTVTITVPDSPGGLHDLTVRYAAPHGPKNAALSLNGSPVGEVPLAESAGFTEATGAKLQLVEGDNTVTFGTGWGWYLVDAISLTPSAPPAPGTYEAEDGELSGVVVESTVAGFSGRGYVAGFDTATDHVTITVPDSPGGLHDLSISYATPYGPKTASLSLNGSGLGDVAFPENPTFTGIPAGKVLLREGDNTITITNNWGWYLIDAIRVTPSAPRGPHQVTSALTDRSATPAAKGLMRYLVDNYGEKTLSGQQDQPSIDWVERNTGKAPAIAGLDLMDYSPSRVERGTTSQEVERAIAYDARGGIVTMAWHWNAPSGLIDQPGKEWWRGFYTDATTFDVAAALADPASTDHGLLIRDIDAIAVQLKRLADANVPVLWRPLHEAEGGWFWWGAKGPEPAKALYRIVYDRLVRHHGLHNLIWVWNSIAPEWYPGDDVVDVVSMDSYPPVGDHGPVIGPYERLVELGGDRKLVALGEVGSIPDPELVRAYEARWSWFVTWSGSFIQDGVTNPLDFVRRVYHDPGVITLDELPDFKSTPGDCTATMRVVARWGGGYHAEITVRHAENAPSNGWKVTWQLDEGQRVEARWSARITTSGTTATAENLAWNAAVKPGESTTFGFLGTGSPTAPAPTCAIG
ncbi:glycosyl hydrolase [Saccharothrix longispora]|uniref:glycosyl hydrolase n=1 Tax=Saccharothrix longispora TaxID=33920 RepID=UPI0028FD8E8A|nr:glycosyl hydrolase [Saccharothrix longispora]MDU0289259.1 glycosyl hydrolase [Saccharothrix longispora]